MNNNETTPKVKEKEGQEEEVDETKEIEEKERNRLCKETRRPQHDFVSTEINDTTKDADSSTQEMVKRSHQKEGIGTGQEKIGTGQKRRGTPQENNADMGRSAPGEDVTFLTQMTPKDNGRVINSKTVDRGVTETRATTDRGAITDRGVTIDRGTTDQETKTKS